MTTKEEILEAMAMAIVVFEEDDILFQDNKHGLVYCVARVLRKGPLEFDESEGFEDHGRNSPQFSSDSKGKMPEGGKREVPKSSGFFTLKNSDKHADYQGKMSSAANKPTKSSFNHTSGASPSNSKLGNQSGHPSTASNLFGSAAQAQASTPGHVEHKFVTMMGALPRETKIRSASQAKNPQQKVEKVHLSRIDEAEPSPTSSKSEVKQSPDKVLQAHRSKLSASAATFTPATQVTSGAVPLPTEMPHRFSDSSNLPSQSRNAIQSDKATAGSSKFSSTHVSMASRKDGVSIIDNDMKTSRESDLEAYIQKTREPHRTRGSLNSIDTSFGYSDRGKSSATQKLQQTTIAATLDTVQDEGSQAEHDFDNDSINNDPLFNQSVHFDSEDEDAGQSTTQPQEEELASQLIEELGISDDTGTEPQSTGISSNPAISGLYNEQTASKASSNIEPGPISWADDIEGLPPHSIQPSSILQPSSSSSSSHFPATNETSGTSNIPEQVDFLLAPSGRPRELIVSSDRDNIFDDPIKRLTEARPKLSKTGMERSRWAK